MSSRARHLVAVLLSAVLVFDHGASEMFGELSFLALGGLPVVVGAAGAAAHPDLGDRSEVELHLPKTSSAHVTPHARTREGCRRGDRIFVR